MPRRELRQLSEEDALGNLVAACSEHGGRDGCRTLTALRDLGWSVSLELDNGGVTIRLRQPAQKR